MTKRRIVRSAVLLLLVAAAALFVWWESQEEHDHHPASSSRSEFDPHSQTAQAASVAVFATLQTAESFTLPNGLQVVVIPDSNAAEATHMVWYKAGSADDPAGKSGLAHFVEHLTFAESRGDRQRRFSQTLQKLGEKQDALTTYDYTVYYQLVPERELQSVLALEAHRMSQLRFDNVPLAAERKEVLEERREVEANAEMLLDQQTRAALYRNHPYGNPVLGLPGEFDNISAPDALEFYRQRYSPGNALLLVHGRVDVAEIKSLAEKYFDGIPMRPVAARGVPRAVGPPAANPIVMKDARANESLWKRDHLVPSYTTGAAEHTYPLQVLAEILGGGPESRLPRLLVEQNKLANSVHVHYDPDSLDLSTFSIVATLRPGADAGDLEKSVQREFQALAAAAPAAAELAHAKQDLKAKAAFSEEKMPPAAKLVGEALTRGRTLRDAQAWPRRIDAVAGEQVRAAARAVFAAPSVTGVLLQAEPPTGRERGR